MTSAHYDVIIVGSGQSGTPLASAFAAAGRKTALIEGAHIGGTCVNEGCTPTNTMIASGRVAYLARRGEDYGVQTEKVAIDMVKIRQRKRNIVSSRADGSRKRLVGVDVINGEASFSAPKTLAVQMIAGGEKTVRGETILINTGERPRPPNLKGLDRIDKKRVLNSTSIMELAEVPEHLIVLGGGYVGLEFGQLFRRLGAEVTVIQRAAQLVPKEDLDVAVSLNKILEEDGIRIHLLTSAVSISNAGYKRRPIVLETDRAGSISGSHILFATGRIPNTDMLNLDWVGVKTNSRGHIVVNERLETTASGIYALGDVHGGPAFTHMSYDDFRIIRANLILASVPANTVSLTTTQASRSRILTPYVIYTDPQLAHVGLHERDLETMQRKTKTARMPMGYVARAIETDETRGLMKATVDAETGDILGFTCLGVEGGEVMSIVQTAMMGGVKWWDLEAAVWAHPSLAESLNNLWAYLQ
ncbi:uncharacterized protein BCR38DRAFT_488958 [Pseudomassariella vexata]|uniref:Mercuric reductase n=1 Tax=Pseudomassariella vexata TaxID=1141098 RepID=A0A1Y2DJ31_9PEZI|nr:uncharacterized protein BCR38DRAFT_488958 [Pseudomassariella vexata]ORY59222.1 hypothetical protein BCR38DRAFT_488958 [Pseudomassariella vexata]